MKTVSTKGALIATSVSILLMVLLPSHAGHHQTDSNTISTVANVNNSQAVNYVNSDKRAYAAMQALPVNEPIYMLNMIRYNAKAKYQAGSKFAEKGWTGAQAYMEYIRHSAPIAERTGSTATFVGEPQLTLIGPEHERWDSIFIASYPNLSSFLDLVGNADYQKHAFHRSAAVADSRLVRMALAPAKLTEDDPIETAAKSINPNYIDPTKKSLEAMSALPQDEPIYMLNMIRLKDKANYQGGSKFSNSGWTGNQAYTEYRRHAGPIVARLGGKSIFEAVSQLTLIGPEQENWDYIFIIYYPNVAALKALIEDPEYQAHAFHRSAGVADSRLIRITSSQSSE